VRPEQVLVADLVALLLVTALVGLAWRNRLHLCRPFSLYLAVTLLTNRLVVWLPEYFFTLFFWTIKETVQALLTLFVATDLVARGFARWPRARQLATALTLAGVALWSLSSVVGVGATTYRDFASIVLPRIEAAAACGFVALFAIGAWYHLPLGRLHRTIVAGFGLYLALYAVILWSLRWTDWSGYAFLSALEPAVYGASVGIWALAAWGEESRKEAAIDHLWWLLVSPGQRHYFEDLEAMHAGREHAIEFAATEAASAEQAGDHERATRLRAAIANFATTPARQERMLLAMRRRALAAIGGSK
jgi:hypothetical protein